MEYYGQRRPIVVFIGILILAIAAGLAIPLLSGGPPGPGMAAWVPPTSSPTPLPTRGSGVTRSPTRTPPVRATATGVSPAIARAAGNATPTTSPTRAPTATPTTTPTSPASVTATAALSPLMPGTPSTVSAGPGLSPVVATTAPQPSAIALQPPTSPRPALPTATEPAPPNLLSAPELLEPAPNAVRNGRVTFRWQPTGPLPGGTAYEVVWWNRDDNPADARGIAAAVRDVSLTVNLDVLYESHQIKHAEIYWCVLIVQATPYVRLTQPDRSTARLLVYQPPEAVPSPPK